MPTQLQLEGPDLESLLTRVKTELGHSARIVRAEKVRTGGIGGFFAKQRFEISVEVGDEGEPVTPVAPAAPEPMSLLDLADRVSSAEQRGVSLRHTPESRSTVAAVTAPSAAPVSPTAPAPAPAAAPAPRFTAPASLPAAVPSVNAQAPAADDATFSAVLAGLQTAKGTGPTAIPVLVTPQPPVAPAADVTADQPSLAEQASVAEQPVAPERPTHVSTEGTTFATLVAHLESTAGAGEVTTSPAKNKVPSAPAVPQFLEPGTVEGTVVTIPAARTPESVTAPVALPVHLPFGRSAGAPTVHGQLARLGLPAHLQPRGADEAIYPNLLKSLRALPKAPAPTNRAGAVLAVVGPLPQSLEAARALARELKLQPASAVVLATSRRTLTDLPERQVLRDVDQAELRRTSWRRKRNMTIVAIDAPMTAAGAVQARAYLSALAPSATWGAVEATRKPLDIGAFARAVGGFDALTLSAVDETSDPAAVLALGIPVARLGEEQATPSAWAALLTGRLAA